MRTDMTYSQAVQVDLSKDHTFRTLKLIRDRMTKQFKYDGLWYLQPADIQRFMLHVDIDITYIPTSESLRQEFDDSIDAFVILVGKQLAAYQESCPDLQMSEIVPIVAKQFKFTHYS